MSIINFGISELCFKGCHEWIEISKTYYSGMSKFQKVEVVNMTAYGKALYLDNILQSAEHDEHSYHESLVHFSLLSHPNPKRVFIGGGGEGATAREILKYPSVEKLVMVDIDGDAVEACRKHMPEWSNGAFEDPRMELIIDDAYKYLEETKEEFDIIIMDIVDPDEAGPGWKLYTKEFYQFVNDKFLKNEGIMVTQSTQYRDENSAFPRIAKTLKEIFSVVVPYFAEVPSFSESWAFNMATNSKAYSLINLETPLQEIDEKIAQKLGLGKLQVLDGEGMLHRLHMSKKVRENLEKEAEFYTLEKPLIPENES